MTTAVAAVFTEHLGAPCRHCGRRFYVTRGSLDYAHNDDPDASDADLAAELDLCLGCVTGGWFEGEYPLLETERVARPMAGERFVILTTKQGYLDALALMGELWAGTLTPLTIALNAPYPELARVALDLSDFEDPDNPCCEWCGQACPNGSEFAPFCSRACYTLDAMLSPSDAPPPGKRHPITSVESQTYIDTGEWPDVDVDCEWCGWTHPTAQVCGMGDAEQVLERDEARRRALRQLLPHIPGVAA